MNPRIEQAISVAVAGAALLVAVSFAYRTFAAPSLPSGLHRAARRLDADQWATALENAVTLHGSPTASVTVLEFTDLECPACAGFQSSIDELIDRHGNDVHIALVHFPLSRHRFAIPAARAFECAANRGQGLAFARATYAAQDSIGLIGWGEIARRAGLPDTTRIRECALADSLPANIAVGRSLGSRLRLSGTPTIFVNRWNLGVPSREVLDSVVTSILEAARP